MPSSTICDWPAWKEWFVYDDDMTLIDYFHHNVPLMQANSDIAGEGVSETSELEYSLH